MIHTGGDSLLALLLFWSMFLPMGARFSVDSALNNGPHRESNRYLSTATAAVLLQVGMVYIFTAIMKSDPIWRENFSAVYYALKDRPVGDRARSLPAELSRHSGGNDCGHSLDRIRRPSPSL